MQQCRLVLNVQMIIRTQFTALCWAGWIQISFFDHTDVVLSLCDFITCPLLLCLFQLLQDKKGLKHQDQPADESHLSPTRWWSGGAVQMFDFFFAKHFVRPGKAGFVYDSSCMKQKGVGERVFMYDSVCWNQYYKAGCVTVIINKRITQ